MVSSLWYWMVLSPEFPVPTASHELFFVHNIYFCYKTKETLIRSTAHFKRQSILVSDAAVVHGLHNFPIAHLSGRRTLLSTKQEKGLHKPSDRRVFCSLDNLDHTKMRREISRNQMIHLFL